MLAAWRCCGLRALVRRRQQPVGRFLFRLLGRAIALATPLQPSCTALPMRPMPAPAVIGTAELAVDAGEFSRQQHLRSSL